jgi:invasion protein IalB
MTYFDRQEPRLYSGPARRGVALGPTARLARKRTIPWLEIVLVAMLVLGAAYAVRFLLIDRPSPATEAAPHASVAPETSAVAQKPVVRKEAAEPPATSKVAEQALEPAAQPTYTTETIGDWSLICPAAPAPEKCSLQQRLTAQDGGTAFLWTISRDAEGIVRAVWQTPADVNREPGMAMDLGDGQPRTVPFEGCDANSCRVKAVLAPVYLDALARAPTVSALVLTGSNNQIVRYQLSPKGLAEALARL